MLPVKEILRYNRSMSDELIRAAEAAGLYIESSTSSIATEDVEMFCENCGKTLMTRKRGEMLFTQTYGKCSCSWHCCEDVEALVHARHLAYREMRVAIKVKASELGLPPGIWPLKIEAFDRSWMKNRENAVNGTLISVTYCGKSVRERMEVTND
jgi:hypothetical protein